MTHSLGICNSLHDDHMLTVRILEDAESMLSRIGRKAPPDTAEPETARWLATLAATLKSEIVCHFAFEEEHLFPRVREFGDTPMLTILLDEHETIRPLAAEVADAVRDALANGFTAGSWKIFHDRCQELIEREVFHIQKEEMGLLPMLDQVIDPDDDADLAMALGESKAASV